LWVETFSVLGKEVHVSFLYAFAQRFSALAQQLIEGKGLPTFQCTVCGRKTRSEFEVSCTGEARRNVEKAQCCCGKLMIETLED
jgi:hypothetical protein